MHLTGEELLELHFLRSEDAVDATRQKYGSYCQAIVWNILSDREGAEECLGDVWLKVWNAIPPERPSRFKGWLGAVARNCAPTMRRARDRRPQQTEDAALELALALSGGPEGRLEARELGQAISDFLAAQPEANRNAFLRRYWYGNRVEEAAGRTGWSVGKTKTVLFRMRKKLKNYLDMYLPMYLQRKGII